MSDKNLNINTADLLRHMDDQAHRAESNGFLNQKKYTHLQKIFLKMTALPEKEFEVIFSTLESMIENFYTQKTSTEEVKNKKVSVSLFTGKP
jgi:hypothetical protein